MSSLAQTNLSSRYKKPKNINKTNQSNPLKLIKKNHLRVWLKPMVIFGAIEINQSENNKKSIVPKANKKNGEVEKRIPIYQRKVWLRLVKRKEVGRKMNYTNLYQRKDLRIENHIKT